MRMRSVVTLSNAAWREAVRQREAFVDVDHLLLGLLAAGGPAAHLLAHHGLTLAAGRRAARECQAATLASLGVDAGALPATRPRPTHELHRAAAGHAPLTERSRRLLDGLGRRGVERELLRALLAEPSGTIPEVLARAGVDPSAVAAGLRNTTDWDTPTPRHVSTDAPTGDGRTTTAVVLEHFVAAPAAVLHRVISEPELVRQWTMWRPESRVCDGELVDATSNRAAPTRTDSCACATRQTVSAGGSRGMTGPAGGSTCNSNRSTTARAFCSLGAFEPSGTSRHFCGGPRAS